MQARSSLKTEFRMRSRLRGRAYKESPMSCPACGRVYRIEELTCIKHPETIESREVSAGNKLSVAKFLCPEPGCGKSVDVKYRDDGTVNIARYHSMRGERVSMVGGPKVVSGRIVSLTSLAELHKKQQEAFSAQMTAMIGKAEDAVKSADLKIEAQLAVIRQAEERIVQIKADRTLAEEILTNPEYTQYRKAV